ncbi:adenylosuccinate lyase [Candidatus Roizmanbacteria bacterium RIFCSPLOWO2_02_FULL_37_19]|uniref:Adenylosuccinate lyase n=1 Tax=Candidatus Roizmanbacteria bacterium RIFCSPHIGHO2_02_FULL_37_24 TaxID=1802037 RepID=A0A1F7H1B6_9BACT|nr:MAG: adenylosuccinate lyase [Candidatus Roizmanbacteria bacterium RIFCSPHIGHO2_01_FULL_38_41]OGK24724.1 MAG: adenylosuccinate lyase [Candidatus Roizmanbacteria bacterium RIFCSPHIGHO2_02_FULL_37_24]OGK32900.1 MAG: adenylosuccinate lyase [Candidatus Roizmanbacteria bacterium RIFCSPHIGHO2_12_FULL_37_23]OGK44115.1 MAG: adenylosuccinate lyase [Candidatus Roizmanbacteria bacterium RIFCSPLOWO2_01_FULL_37_57]OGK54378.1 MAG: adenylosuccinate lyase [Candidatus Roizmanbacteria bacterium RIFCSPLOWO2_02_
MGKIDFDTYQSVFSWRYGSKEMRRIFSEKNKYKIWRKIWIALAEVQHKEGLVSASELKDLKSHQDEIDIERILEIEKETKHDVVAAIKEFAEKAKIGGGKIHLGATSMDIVDNADSYRIRQALGLIRHNLITLLEHFAQKIDTYSKLPTIGYTHLQPAEPTTVGYRLSLYAQDLLIDLELLDYVLKTIKAKGMKGAVGTSASYKTLTKNLSIFEKTVMEKLELEPSVISNQVYTRKYDFLALSVLASISSSLSKYAADLRILQSAQFGEWSEPFGKKQVGSSSMPYKKNPLTAENICSLGRLISQMTTIALENASHSYLERTLDDSANKRVIFPDAFLATDEMMMKADKIIVGLVVNKERISYNLKQYAPFLATEKIILETVRKGADRQEMHEELRVISMKAWEEVQIGKQNPMKFLLMKNKNILQYIEKDEIEQFLHVENHIGDAPERAQQLIKMIRAKIKQ